MESPQVERRAESDRDRTSVWITLRMLRGKAEALYGKPSQRPKRTAHALRRLGNEASIQRLQLSESIRKAGL
jgi:hypothetical protein